MSSYADIQHKIVYNKADVESFYKNKQEIYEPEDGETIIIIARHGENESNIARTYDGRTLNKPLTPKGHEQGENAGLQQRSSELKGKVVLVVTHSGTIRSIYWHLAHQLNFFVPYVHFKPKNGAYMIVSVKNGEMTLRETNDISIIPPAS